jgi:carbonic anhydrase/acetyltransferase-like protein (isoleucine patch superfamily)
VHKKTARVGGNFTRVGIGHRIENSYGDLTNKAGTYEIGELVAIVSADTGQVGHGKLYLCAANAGAIGDFIEIGGASGFTIDTNDNITFTGQSIVAPIIRTTANVGIRTDTPAQDLHVVGNALITMNVIIGEYVSHSGDLNTYTGFPSNDTYVIYTNGAVRLQADSTGKIGIHTASPVANLHLAGNAYITSNVTIDGNVTVKQNVIVSGDISTSSDIRLKSNISLIDNALSKVKAIEGVYFERNNQPGRRVGVIAQQIEQVLPEVVIQDGEYKTVTYGNIVGLLVEAIKELQGRIEMLETKVEDLSGNNT